MGERDKEEKEGMNSSMTYLVYYKNFCNATMYLYPAQQYKKRGENPHNS
jgi:hypothetical protein